MSIRIGARVFLIHPKSSHSDRALPQGLWAKKKKEKWYSFDIPAAGKNGLPALPSCHTLPPGNGRSRVCRDKNSTGSTETPVRANPNSCSDRQNVYPPVLCTRCGAPLGIPPPPRRWLSVPCRLPSITVRLFGFTCSRLGRDKRACQSVSH